MKKGLFLPPLIGVFLFAGVSLAAELIDLDFYQKGGVSNLELKFDSENVEINKYNLKKDKQIILDLKNVSAKSPVVRDFDTSEFSGSTVFVSAHKNRNNPKDLRITVQLRDNVRSILNKRKNRVILRIENSFGSFAKGDDWIGIRSKDRRKGEDDVIVHVPKSDSVEDILANVIQSGQKKYIGKKISFKVKDMGAADMLRMIADYSGFNIILPDEIKTLPPFSLHLINIPWDQVLDTILQLYNLVAKKNGNILMVSTYSSVLKEKQEEIKAMKIAEEKVPLVTKAFPISYAKIGDLVKIIEKYISKRGSTTFDNRTNILIVSDVAEGIERVKKIIDTLDRQTPQVLIESKIVEVREAYSKEIGLKNGITFGYDPVGETGAMGASPKFAGYDKSIGPGFSFSSAPTANLSFFGMKIARFKRLIGLDFTLQLMESESKAKVIASPKVIAQNMMQAELGTVDTTSYAIETIDENNNRSTNFEKTEAKLNMKVTPQVTNEGSINLTLDISKEHFGLRPKDYPSGPPEKASRNIKTNVLVNNGSTIVIGGIYTFSKSEVHSGIPFLKDIPLVGWLFRTPYKPEKNKSELVIFITPRIINQEEAGLTGRPRTNKG